MNLQLLQNSRLDGLSKWPDHCRSRTWLKQSVLMNGTLPEAIATWKQIEMNEIRDKPHLNDLHACDISKEWNFSQEQLASKSFILCVACFDASCGIFFIRYSMLVICISCSYISGIEWQALSNTSTNQCSANSWFERKQKNKSDVDIACIDTPYEEIT